VSGWDQRHDIEHLEAQLRALDGRESLDAEIEMEVTRIRRMFDAAKRRLGLTTEAES
jgi:hypothetical protein